MPFTISPTEAQALQEDEAQLLNAIAQIAQRVPGVFRGNPNGNDQQATDSLRIKMGRRLVYGQLADGPFRHELDANSLKVIADALQQPVTPGVNPEKYLRKVPAIEIFDGGVLLFREERDGTVTTNEIYFEVEEQASQQRQNEQSVSLQETTTAEPLVDSKPVEIEPVDAEPLVAEPLVAATAEPIAEPADNSIAVARASQLLITAQYLLNPLRQSESIYDEVFVQGYHIKNRGSDIIVSESDSVVLHARNGELVNSQVTDLDWAILGQIQVPERLPQPILNDLPKPAVNETSQVQNEETQSASDSQSAPALSAEALPANDSVTQGPDNGLDAAGEHSAITILERETQNLPASNTRQLLEATVQDWKQQASQRFSSHLQKGANWLVNQRTALQNQRLAYAVHQLFQRGYERTGEQSYHVRDCTITRRGQNLYVLKDAVGELMQFKTSKVMGFGRRMTVLSVSDSLTHSQRQNLLNNQLDSSTMPQGSLDVEAAYAAKTQKVEKTVRQFLTNFAQAHTWNRENGQFKLEIGEGDTLRITDKQDGRGVVFERNNGEVSSKLAGQDFAHFERLSAKMENMAARQSQTTNGKFANNGAKKSHAIEID
ncbi:MAG: hypothetical protein AAFV90_25370 [Cyanobacteria bacterium J06634_5]